jgi:hypothetical protein
MVVCSGVAAGVATATIWGSGVGRSSDQVASPVPTSAMTSAARAIHFRKPDFLVNPLVVVVKVVRFWHGVMVADPSKHLS